MPGRPRGSLRGLPERPLLMQSSHRAVSLSGEVVVMVRVMLYLVVVVRVEVIVTLSAGSCCVQRRMCSERGATSLAGGYKGVRSGFYSHCLSFIKEFQLPMSSSGEIEYIKY